MKRTIKILIGLLVFVNIFFFVNAPVYAAGIAFDASYTGTAQSGQPDSSNGTSNANPGGSGLTINADTVNLVYGKRQIDEFRVSSIGRSADWIATEYNNQSSPSTFLTFGSEQGNIATPAPHAQGIETKAKAIIIRGQGIVN